MGDPGNSFTAIFTKHPSYEFVFREGGPRNVDIVSISKIV